MKNFAITTLCLGTCAAAVLFAFSGCRTLTAGADAGKPGNAPVTTITVPIYNETSETTADRTPGETTAKTPGGLPASGTVGDLKYEIVPATQDGQSKKRGYLVYGEGEGEYPYTIIVAAGEFNTGGYSIEVANLEYDGSALTITVLQTEPAPDSAVIQAFTYPCCAVRFDKLPKTIKVVSKDGTEFECLYYYNAAAEIENGYIAVLENGSGEIVQKTYVYQTADGKYRYDHATATTERWGSTKWKEVLHGSGFADTREEVVEEAKKFGSAGFVMYPGDNNPHSISEFIADKK